MTHQRPDISGLLAEWAVDLRGEVVGELPYAEIASVAHLAAETALVGVVGTAAILEGGMTMTTTSIGATAAAGLKAKIVAGSLAAALTAGGAAAATGNLPDGAQSFAADVAGSIGLDLPRPETTVDLFARTDIAADEFITVSTVGRVGVALEGGTLVLTDIMGNAGVTASVVAETAESIIVEFVSEAEVATVVVTATGEEILSDISRTEFSTESGGGVVIETPIGSVESDGATSGEGSVSGSNSSSDDAGTESGGAVVEAETGATVDVTAEQCLALDAATEAAGDLGIGLTGGGAETVIGAEGSSNTDAIVEACASMNAEAEGSGTARVGTDG